MLATSSAVYLIPVPASVNLLAKTLLKLAAEDAAVSKPAATV
jgi:hypothetical protein